MWPSTAMSKGVVWQKPPSNPHLERGDVHVWRCLSFSFPDGLQWANAVLSPKEREQTNVFYHDHDRNQYVLSHGALRTILDSYLLIAPQKLQFRKYIYGKPHFKMGTSRAPIRFNLSHAGDITLITMSPFGKIGVDVELIRGRAASHEQSRELFLQRTS